MKQRSHFFTKYFSMLCLLAGTTLLFSPSSIQAQATQVNLRVSNGQFICAEGGGGGSVLANRPSAGAWETFTMEELGNGKIALKTSNGKYLSAQGGGGSTILANGPARNSWEVMTMENLGNNQIALRASNGQYLCAEGGGGGVIVANRPSRGAWETFTLVRLGQSAAAPANPLTDADMCWTESRTRGAGTFPTTCGPNEDYDAGLCYPKCQAGYVGVGPVCWKSCPPGYRDDGGFCAKPAAYGRGAGYPWKFGDGLNLDGARARCEKENRQGCEKYGEIMYPKCREGFSPAGCCVCSPVCPAGFVDIGVSCTKPSYGRGAGTVPKNCPAGKVNQAGLCYVPCPAGFNGVGPVCWANQCPNVFPARCAAGCARSSNACIKAVVSQVTTPLEMVANIAGIALSGGGSAVAKSAAVTSAKTIAKASIKSQMIRKAKEMGKELLETAAENAASTVYEAQLTGEFSWEDLDPTGVANVVKAFNKPLCRDFK